MEEEEFANLGANFFQDIMTRAKAGVKINLNLPGSMHVVAFNWIETKELLKKLCYVLINKKIIEEIEFEQFSKAFSGEKIIKNLMIIWKPWKGNSPNKVELFYFLDTLVDEKLIENVFPESENATELYNKIEKIFVDVNGLPVKKNIKQSYQNFRKNKFKDNVFKATKNVSDGKRKDSQAFILKVGTLLSKEKDSGKEGIKLKKFIEKGIDKNADKYKLIVQMVINDDF